LSLTTSLLSRISVVCFSGLVHPSGYLFLMIVQIPDHFGVN
jgi:hypothetical protein